MRNKYGFTFLLLAVLALTGFGLTKAYVSLEEGQDTEEIEIVTSFYPMYIAAKNVVGDLRGVKLENLSEPQTGCLHDYQLTPQDMILLSEADVFIVNGGGIESFLADVVQEYPKLTVINAGEGILAEDEADPEGESLEEPEGPLVSSEDDGHGHEHGENTHVWMSMEHYMQQVENIAEGLKAADPTRLEDYEKNASAYKEAIEKLAASAGSVKETAGGENIVILHEAFAYLAEDYGMKVAGLLNLDEERQVSAGEVADILRVIEKKDVKVLLAEKTYGKDMAKTIEAETGCRVYYLDPLVRGDYEADSWLLGMKENIAALKKAFSADGNGRPERTDEKPAAGDDKKGNGL